MTPPERWEPVPNNATLLPGSTYRIVGAFRGPYTPVTREAVKRGMQVNLEARGNRFLYFLHAPPLMTTRETAQVWPFTVAFKRNADAPVQAGVVNARGILLILGTVIAAAIALSIVSAKLERLIETVGKVVEQITRPILSPGTLVLAALGIFLIMRAKVRAST